MKTSKKSIFAGILSLFATFCCSVALFTGVSVQAKAENTASISGMSLTLNDNIVVNCLAQNIPETYTQAEMKFTYLGKDYTETADVSQGQATFRFNKVTPQYFTENVTAQLLLDGEAVGEQKTFTVKKYCEDLLSYTATDLGISATKYAAMQTLAVDLLYYGDAAQAYTSTNTDVLATAGLDETQKGYKSTYATVTETDLSYVNTDSQMRWYGYGLRFDYNVSLYVKFALKNAPTQEVSVNFSKAGITEETTVSEYGTVAGYTVYKASYTNIAATEFDEAISAQVYVGDVAVGTPLVYSVQSFAYDFQGNEETGALAQNVYNYGKAAEAYDAATEALITPTWQAIRIVPANTKVEFNRDTTNQLLGTEKTAQVDYVRFDFYDYSDTEKTVLGSFKLYAVDANGYISNMDGSNEIKLDGALDNLYLTGSKYVDFLTMVSRALGDNYIAGQTYSLKAQVIARAGTGYIDSEVFDFNTIRERTFTATHNLQHVEAVDPTCTTAGNIEYWYCTLGCGKYFADETATNEITAEDVVLTARHTLSAEGVDNGDGTKTFTCSVCGEDVVKTVLPVSASLLKFRSTDTTWTFEYDRMYSDKSSLFAKEGVDYVNVFVYEGEELVATIIMDDEVRDDNTVLYFTDLEKNNKVSIGGTAGNAYQVMAPIDWCKGTLAVFLGDAYKTDTAYSFKVQTVAVAGSAYCDSAVLDTGVTVTSVAIVDLLPTPTYNAIKIVSGNGSVAIDRTSCFLRNTAAADLDYIEYSFYLSTDSTKTVLGKIKAYTDGTKGYLSAIDGTNVITLSGALDDLYTMNESAWLTLMRYALGDNYKIGSTYYVKVQLKAAAGSAKGDSAIYDVDYVNNRVFVAE